MMTYLEGQIEVRKAWILYWQTVILSGSYKNRKLFHGTSGPEFTEEEKVEESLKTMLRHVHQLSELVEELNGGQDGRDVDIDKGAGT